MNYLVYLFDFDYTLVDSSSGIIKSINYALRKTNNPICSNELIQSMIGEPLEKIFSNVSKTAKTTKFSDFREYFMECSLRYMHENVVIYDDTVTTLKTLKNNNKKIGILSAKDHFTIKKIAQQFGFLEYVDIILGEDDVEKQKPAADQIRLSLRMLKSSYKDTLYVGDSTVDAKAACNAKVDFCAITKGKTTRAQMEKFPHIGIVDRLSDVLHY